MEKSLRYMVKGEKGHNKFCFFFIKEKGEELGDSILEGYLIILPPHNWKDFKSLTVPSVGKDVV